MTEVGLLFFVAFTIVLRYGAGLNSLLEKHCARFVKAVHDTQGMVEAAPHNS